MTIDFVMIDFVMGPQRHGLCREEGQYTFMVMLPGVYLMRDLKFFEVKEGRKTAMVMLVDKQQTMLVRSQQTGYRHLNVEN